MANKVKWTSSAWLDLEATAEYIARDSSSYAASWIIQIRKAGRSLHRFPGLGRIVPEFEENSIRELIVGNYRLIYQVASGVIYVIAIIHGARDLAAL